MSTERVVVTGAGGFVAMQCVATLLEAGYAVRGTVRSLSSEAALRRAWAPWGGESDRLELVRADLLRDDGWSAVMAGCRDVLHVASPFPTRDPKDADELIRPARDGARRVLQAASNAGVRRVVMTSSMAAVVSGHDRSADRVYDEQTWSDLTQPMTAYERSKTLAEQAAWELVDSLPADRRIELVTILPTMVLGPMLRVAPSTSSEMVRRLLQRKDPGCADLAFHYVDVRDVADAHLAALRIDEARGQRFLCGNGEPTYMIEMAQILSQHFGPAGYRIRDRLLPRWLIRLVALVDPSVAAIVPYLGESPRFRVERIREALGIEIRSAREAIIAMAQSLIDHRAL